MDELSSAKHQMTGKWADSKMPPSTTEPTKPQPSQEIPSDGLSDDEIRVIYKLRTVAVVGISRDPQKAAHYVPKYLMENGYEIIPVNPFVTEILGRPSYKSLLDVKQVIDIVDVFRPSDEVVEVAEMAVAKGAKVLWMQEGIYNEKAASLARSHGLKVAWNRCLRRTHLRLFKGIYEKTI